MLTYLSTFISAFVAGKLNSVLTHIVLLGGAIVAEFMVAVGIILEAPKVKTRRERMGMVLVLGGVSVSAILAIALFVFDEGISRALEKRAGPRLLEADSIHRIIDTLKPFGPHAYDLSVAPQLEPGSNLLNIILSMLSKQLGWQLQAFPEGISPTRSLSPFEALYVMKDIPPVMTPQQAQNIK